MGPGLLGSLVERCYTGAAHPVFNQDKRVFAVVAFIGLAVEPGPVAFGFPMPFQGEMWKPD